MYRSNWWNGGAFVANRRRCVLTGLVVAVSLFFLARSAVGMFDLDVPQAALIAASVVLGAGFVHVLKVLGCARGLAVMALHGLCGLVLASMIPPVMDAYPKVQVVATGERNARAGGTEVWLPDIVPGRVYFEGAGWERRQEALAVSHSDQPNTAELRGKWHDGDALRLAMHPYSGIAMVRIGSVEQRIDLYAETQTVMAIDLPGPASSLTGRLRRLLYGVIPLLAALSLGAVVATLPSRWRTVMTASMLLATLTGVGVGGRSYPGALELLAYGSGAIASLEADTGSGMFALPLKEGAGGPTVEVSARRGSGEAVSLVPESGYLRPLRPLAGPERQGRDAVPPPLASDICARGQGLQVLQHIAGEGRGIRVEIGAMERRLRSAPDPVSGQANSYVVVQCAANRISVSYSQAYVRISPWAFPHSPIQAVRLQDASGRVLPVLQISTDGPVGYIRASENGRGYSRSELARPDTRAFFLQKVIAACLAGTIPFLVWIAASSLAVARRNWLRGRRLLVAWIYLAPALWVFLLLAVQWPGTLGWDAFSPFLQAQVGTITLWYGIGYPMIVDAMFLLMPPVMIGVLQCVIAALVVQWVMIRCVESGTAARRVGALACLLLPLTIIPFGATVHLRDAMNGVLITAFGVLWATFVLRQDSYGATETLAYRTVLCIFGVCLVLLRIDNIILLTLLFAAMPLMGRNSRRSTVVYAAAVLVAMLVANAIAERVIFGKSGFSQGERNRYAEAALVGPLVGFLTDPTSRLSEADKRGLEKDLGAVIDVRRAVSNWSPFHVVWWHHDVEGRPLPSGEAIRALKKDLVKGIWADPLRFLDMRRAVFLSMLGHRWIQVPQSPAGSAEVVRKFADRVWMSEDADTVATKNLLGFSIDERPFARLSRIVFDIYDRTATTLPQFILCLLLVGLIRVVPVSGVMALALLARACVFFFLAPADVFLYLYDMHFLGFLLLPMAVCEWAWSRKPAQPRVHAQAKRGWQGEVPSK